MSHWLLSSCKCRCRVNAIVVGEVGQYSTVHRQTDPVNIPTDPEDRALGDAPIYPGLTLAQVIAIRQQAMAEIDRQRPAYVTRPGKQWTESFASASVRVIDVETGLLLYSASGQYQTGHTNPPQQLLEYILQAIVAGWVQHEAINQIPAVHSSMACEKECESMYMKGELRRGISIDRCIQEICR